MSIVLSSKTSDFKYNFYPSLKLEKGKTQEIALLNINTYNSIPNIDESNNKFVYEYNGKIFEILFPTGSYEIKAINNYIQERLVKNKHSVLKQTT